MNDEQIIEYLRNRGRVEPPFDFVASISDSLEAVPQRRVSWFAPWIPAAAAVGTAAVVAAAAMLLGQSPNIGPSPAPIVSPSQSASPSPSASEVTPSPSPTLSSDTDLLAAGNSVQMEIRSVEGVAGTVTIDRGDDVGGYPLVLEPSSETHFFVELFATYDLSAAPETASWGWLDWRIESANGEAAIELLETFPYPVDRRPLGVWPGATVPEDTYTGWIIYAVPREHSAAELDLVYQPPGVADALRIPVRRGGDAPEPVAAVEWPRPDPVYVSQPGLPFTVLQSDEADALFEAPDTCTNPAAGYTVNYPDSWYTNTVVGDVPACSWFSPVFYELNEDGSPPEEIAIAISVFEGAIGFIWVDLYTEDVILDGFEARRYEQGMTKDVAQPTNELSYAYLSYLSNEPEGRKLWAFTGTDYGGDYELNRAVFDRIMASLRWTDEVP